MCFTFGIAGVVIQRQRDIDDASIAAEDFLQIFIAKSKSSAVEGRGGGKEDVDEVNYFFSDCALLNG